MKLKKCILILLACYSATFLRLLINNNLIISRIESLILNKGLNDALKRAEEYSKSGADLILIHSKNNNAAESNPPDTLMTILGQREKYFLGKRSTV